MPNEYRIIKCEPFEVYDRSEQLVLNQVNVFVYQNSKRLVPDDCSFINGALYF